MSIGRAPGYPDYTATGTTGVIPELYGAMILEKWYLTNTLQRITTNKYIGEIKKGKGDAVYVRTRPDITVRDFVNDQSIVWERSESDYVKITIDYAKYYAFEISDITDFMSDINLMEQFAMDGTEQMRIAIENHFFTNINSQAHASNIGATAGAISSRYGMGASGAPIQLSASNMINYLAYIKGVLDEQNVPNDGNRFWVIPSWAEVEFALSDLKNASFTGGEKSHLLNGLIQQVLGINIYVSNNLYSVTDGTTGGTAYYMPFGHPSSLCYADSIVKKTMHPELETTFGSGMKCLHAYGFKCAKPEGFGYVYAEEPTITS